MLEQETKMEIFFPELLNGFPSVEFLGKLCKKFHYEESQRGTLRAVAAEMLPLMRKEAVWETCAPWPFNRADGEITVCEGVVMTLGGSLDALQDRYQEQGLLTEGYMLEALAGELLLQGYRAYNRRVRESGPWHVARYHFPGSEQGLPLESIPQMLKRFSAPIACNEAFCLLPGKSVVFVAELTRDAKVVCEGVCVGCGSLNCPNRMEENAVDLPLTYGYRRIFGKW